MPFRFKHFLLALLSLGACLSTPMFSQELKIERKDKIASYLQDVDQILQNWLIVGDDLYKARFVVPVNFLNDYTEDDSDAIDPFADTSEDISLRTAKKALIEVGVTFGKGSSASYNAETSILTVVQTKEEMDIVEAYLMSGCRTQEKQIPIRAEIYELPSHLALQLLESCEDQGDHTPERNAVRQLMKNGEASLIALPSLISRSGQRSKIVSAYEVPFLANAPQQKNSEAKKTAPSLEIESRSVGTIFEVDTVLGADEWTIDLLFSLEHHTGPPELSILGKGLKSPIFHSKKITSQVSLLKSSYLLVGTWKPTGKAKYQREDLMHVVFVTANIQYINDYGVLAPVEEKK